MEQNTLSILIADDDDGDRANIKRILKNTNLSYETTEVTCMKDVLTEIKNKPFNCIILDYNMPGGATLEGVKLLTKSYPHIAIIMVTGQRDEVIASEALKCGVSYYIPKQVVNAENMGRIMCNALEKSNLKKQADEQREALQSYAHILAHDLQAPVRQIQSFANLIKNDLKDQNYDQAIDHFSYIEKSAQNIYQLIETLSEYNKIDGGNIYFEKTSMDDIATIALNNLGLTITAKSAQITLDRPLPTVIGNAILLTQLLQNLISNSLKYCRAPHPVIHISAKKQDATWQISVQDNGIGIPEKDQKHIFKMFKRLHGKNDEFDGSGIGLATCAKIVKHHKGEIWCRSTPDKGTTFFFTLPTNIE